MKYYDIHNMIIMSYYEILLNSKWNIMTWNKAFIKEVAIKTEINLEIFIIHFHGWY